MSRRVLRIFISSPGDVGPERDLASRVVDRLQGEFASAVALDAIRWEHEPVRATDTFQEQIVPPSETDVVVCILWSRLGTRLPAQFRRRPDGTPYDSGTAFEFEDAKRSYDARGVQDLLVYRKTAEPLVSLRDAGSLRRAVEQWEALEAYLKRWFWNDDGSFKAGFAQFSTSDQFEDLLEIHLRALIQERLQAAGMVLRDDPGAATWLRGSPFRSLDIFDVQHARVFRPDPRHQ